MANKVNIAFSENIQQWNALNFTVSDSVSGYSQSIIKSFIIGTPVASNQVKIGATATETLNNLFNNLVANDANSSVTFQNINDGNISMVFSNTAVYTLEISAFNNSRFLITLIDLPAITPIVSAPFAIQDLEIVIIDTDTNFLPLTVQITQESSPTLKFDSGDDLTGIIMASQLSFNMAVLNGQDAYFKHLFTSDENRFLVQLNAYDTINTKKLLWQGFLLPDQYSEPYTGGVFFVEFTAIDMLASLKGKYFPRWYYENRLPIVEVIAEALKATGLNQNILIEPSFYPAQNNNLSALSIDLKVYNDNEKLTEYYKILEDILTANCMTIVSYNGFWIITGFGQKKEQINTYKQFDVNGAILPDYVFNKVIRQNIYNDKTVNFSLKTPFKRVEVNSNAEGNKNMYSEAVVNNNNENFITGFNSFPPNIVYPYAYPNAGNHYETNDFNDWISYNSISYFVYRFFTYTEKFFQLNFLQPNAAFEYTLTEQQVLVNYYKCPETPFLKSNVKYKLEFEVEASIAIEPPNFDDNLKNGLYDKIAPFQLFVNNLEVLSNRPSFISSGDLRYQTTVGNQSNTGGFSILFKLDYEFELDSSGLAEFRYLLPINNSVDLRLFKLELKKLKIGVVDDYDFTENIRSVRAINYAEVLKYDTNLLSTSDTSIKNNIAIGKPLYSNYFYTVGRTDLASFFQDLQVFLPASVLQVKLQTWRIDAQLRRILFALGFKNAMFLEYFLGGNQEYISSFYYQTYNGSSRMGYLDSFTGRIKKPKKYKAYGLVDPTTVLKYMRVIYGPENLAFRENWIIKNSGITESFNKTIARLLHSIYSKPTYVLEGRVLQNVFPDELLNFYFDNQNRKFIPTRLEIKLFEGKTQLTATEDVYELVTDITYE
jgi:hypothetical protein